MRSIRSLLANRWNWLLEHPWGDLWVVPDAILIIGLGSIPFFEEGFSIRSRAIAVFVLSFLAVIKVYGRKHDERKKVKTENKTENTFKINTNGKLQFAVNSLTYVDIGEMREVKIEIKQDVKTIPLLGREDSVYVYGMRTTSGSGTLTYKPNDSGAADVMDQVLSGSKDLPKIRLVLNPKNESDGTRSGDALITAAGPSISAGDWIAVPINFVISGGLQGA